MYSTEMQTGLDLGFDLGGQYPRLELLHELDRLFGKRECENLITVSDTF